MREHNRLFLHRFSVIFASFFLLIILLAIPLASNAQTDEGAFSIQVTPSPIIDAIKPGVSRTIEFTVRNTGTRKEELRADLKKFNINNSGEVELTDEYPDDVKDWIKLSDPTFMVEPGASFTEKLIINPPETVGFSYNFTIVISRDKEPVNNDGKTKIKGSVAVFTLLAVDRPGVQRKFEISEFSSSRRVYEYLPVDFTVKLKNTGNTIVRPFGNIFIQRTASSSQPISVLKLNDAGGYMLPETSRTFPVDWSDGFPVYVKEGQVQEGQSKSLKWDWSRVQHLRYGKYYAKLVAVYNDGQRDVPVEAEVSFWIIPWKFIIVCLVLLGILITGIVTIVRKPLKTIKNKKATKHVVEQDSTKTD